MNSTAMDHLIEEVIDLLESGDTAGCDEGLIVLGADPYQVVRARIHALTGRWHGESTDEEGEEDERS